MLSPWNSRVRNSTATLLSHALRIMHSILEAMWKV